MHCGVSRNVSELPLKMVPNSSICFQHYNPVSCHLRLRNLNRSKNVLFSLGISTCTWVVSCMLRGGFGCAFSFCLCLPRNDCSSRLALAGEKISLKTTEQEIFPRAVDILSFVFAPLRSRISVAGNQVFFSKLCSGSCLMSVGWAVVPIHEAG